MSIQDLRIARRILADYTEDVAQLEDLADADAALTEVRAAIAAKLARLKVLDPSRKGLPATLDDELAQRTSHAKGEWFPGEAWTP